MSQQMRFWFKIQAIAFLVVNTDITEKKQLETQFLQAQRLESLGTLASGMAHDLNNVLKPFTADELLNTIHSVLHMN
ncbi:hypothetical protein [Chlorogloeopsis fritschii]|uniref:hypothetical protein n=1 Tax=Chlorogloeopsis fritschii TaxID=1124 RepID=UPI003C6CA35A